MWPAGPVGTWPPGLRAFSLGLPVAGAVARGALRCGALALSMLSGAAPSRHARSGAPYLADARLSVGDRMSHQTARVMIAGIAGMESVAYLVQELQGLSEPR